MKNIYITLLLSLSVFGLKAQSFSLKGHTTMADSVNILFGNGVVKTDTLKATNGNFELKGNIAHPDLYTIVLQSKSNPRSYVKQDMFIEGGEITIDADFDKKKITYTLSQPKLNLAYLEYRKRFNPLVRVARLAIDSSYSKVKTEGEKKVYSEVFKFVDQVENDVARQFVSENLDNMVGAFIMFANLRGLPINDMDSIYNRFDPKLRNTRFLTTIAEKVKGTRASLNGKQALVFTQNDVKGKPRSLTDYKGKYVLIDFWASWCAPCRAENPNVVKVYQQYKNKNFAILGVSLDQEKSAWLKAIKDDGLTWDHVSDLKGWDNSVAKMYAVGSVPQNFLIDPQGKIIAQNLRGEELKAKLSELIK